MINDKQITISAGNSRKAVSWPIQTLMWSEFCDKLHNPVRSTETLQEYLALKKSQQDELKDVGGFVGGTVAGGGRRKSNNITGRDLITLDLDNIPTNGTEDILKRVGALGCAAAVYSTRKHSDYAPRLRVIIPLNRTVTPDEYEPIARKLAELIGISFADPTTFEPARLMYWPSCSADSVYVCEVYDRPFCSGDGILGMYSDWHDISSWPQVPGADAIERRRLAKQEDPTHKPGLVGAFCRVYSITAAMDHFIPGMYEMTSDPGRYTYTGGSTSGGAIIYDGDLFMYSHHATDPCSGQLVNAFDMIRLHMFGDRDDTAAEGTPVSRMPSFMAMKDLVSRDAAVTDLMARERLDRAREAFGKDDTSEPVEDSADTDWIRKLAIDGNGNVKKTIQNAVTVLENDPAFKGKIAVDDFAGRGVVIGSLPWKPCEGTRWWTDADYANTYNYMEAFYGITGREKIDNALSIVSDNHHVNEVRDYLLGLKWDGIPRLNTLLTDYLGAADTEYSSAVMRKALVAAVARAIDGSVKFDNMVILTGPQGIGKSTLLRELGKQWFSDSLTTFEGKEAAELIQGTWINEIGELTAMTKQETNSVKQFLSKTDDIYRAAYGRTACRYPRRCVFFGTSNDYTFLKDQTGNRRFWPIDVDVIKPQKNVWTQLPAEVDQIWAEAVTYYQIGEPLHFDKRLEMLAKEAQEEHRESSPKEGAIEEFLSRLIPENWKSIPIRSRKAFWANPIAPDGVQMVERTTVCAAEIWVECFGGELKYMKRQDAAEINSIVEHLPGWEREGASNRGPYGKQKGFRKGQL